MSIGVYILVQNPKTNNYPYLEVINCCLDFADEILLVDGGTDDGSFYELPMDLQGRIKIRTREWPDDADWDFLTQQYDFGLQNLTTDWRIKMDADYIFHEDDIDKIKDLLKENVLGYTFEKSCFNLVDRYRSKTKIPIAVNKSKCPEAHYNTDDQIVDGSGKVIQDDFVNSGIKLWVYDNCFKQKKNIKKVMYKWAKACWDKYGRNWGHESPEHALKFFIDSTRTRIEAHDQNEIPLEAHPKYIQDKIKNMTDKQLGFSLFGYKKASYYDNN